MMACTTNVKLADGTEMPILGYGTFLSQSDALEDALEVALESGYRHFDTAHYYENEKIIGSVLERWFSSGKLNRKDVFIVSKLPPYAMRAQDIEKYIKQSLKDLQLEYLDLYLIHVPFGFKAVDKPFSQIEKVEYDFTTNLVSIWKKMEAQVYSGRTKSIGISNFNIAQISKILDNCSINPSNLQIELNIYHQQNDMVAFCKKNNISVTSYSTLGSPGIGSFFSSFGKEYDVPDILNNHVVKNIAEKYNKTSAQIVLRHLIQKDIIVIPKSLTPERIIENTNVFDFELEESDMMKLNDLNMKQRILDFTFFEGIENHPEYPFLHTPKKK